MGFSEPVSGFALDAVSEEQVYYLIQSVQSLAMHRNKKIYRKMRELVKRACLGVTLALRVEFEEIEKAISTHVVGFDAPAPVDPKLFKAAMRAILQKQEITLEHRSAKRPGEVKQKTVAPLHLAMINHALYLWHHDPELEGKRDADGKPVDPIRKFALTRIDKFSPTGNKAKARKFNIQERLDRGMGAFDDDKLADVELQSRRRSRTATTAKAATPSLQSMSRPARNSGGTRSRASVLRMRCRSSPRALEQLPRSLANACLPSAVKVI